MSIHFYHFVACFLSRFGAKPIRVGINFALLMLSGAIVKVCVTHTQVFVRRINIKLA